MIRYRVYLAVSGVIATTCSVAFWFGLEWSLILTLAGLWAFSALILFHLGIIEAQKQPIRHELDVWLKVSGDLRMVFRPKEDGTLVINFVGPGFQRVLGRTTTELVGQDWKNFCHPDDLEGTIQAAAQVLVTGRVVRQHTNRWRHKQDQEGLPQWIWLEWNALLDPQLGNVFGNARDVTSRFDQDARMNTWAEITSDLLIVADTTIPANIRKPEWVNAAWARKLGWAPEELYEMPIVDLLEPTEAPSVITQREDLDQMARPGVIECRVLCKPIVGRPLEYRFYEWFSQPLNGKVYVTGRDIGMERVHRDQLDKVILDLEARNSDLERFATITAHQLRSPPRTIAGIAQAIQEDYGHLLDEAGAQFLTDIRDSADQMSETVDGLYRFSKVRTSAELALEPVDLQKLMTEVRVDAYKQGCCREQDRLLWSNLPIVLGDKVLLTEVLRNLINNGCKFNESDPKVISVTAVHRDDGRWDITVKDNGIGIAPQYQPKMFQMFQRMHPSYKGTGVGLALVAAIVQKLGGKITLVSEVDKGAAFTFDLEAGCQSGIPRLPASTASDLVPHT